MAVMAFNTSFDLYDWVLFGVLAAGGIGLAYFDTPRYGFVPWAAMAVNAVMLAGWTTYTPHDFTIAVAGFGTLYALSGLVLLPSLGLSAAVGRAVGGVVAGLLPAGVFPAGHLSARTAPAADTASGRSGDSAVHRAR